jgi:hypothetical protein
VLDVAGPSAFYLPLGGDEFESTPATTSPWDRSLQHGGPPSALLARAVEHAPSTPGLVVARFSVDFFGGVPQGRMRTTAQVLRPGRRIELIEATLYANEQVVAVARAWRIKPSPDAVPAPPQPAPPPLPDPQPPRFLPGVDPDWGYGHANEWRFVEGGFTASGRSVVWIRVRLPLVDGEEATGLQRMLVVADSINGLSAVLDLREWLFIPPGLTLHAHRVEAGDWLLLDAQTVLDATGIAVAHGTIADERGQLGLVTQPLLVQRH